MDGFGVKMHQPEAYILIKDKISLELRKFLASPKGVVQDATLTETSFANGDVVQDANKEFHMR